MNIYVWTQRRRVSKDGIEDIRYDRQHICTECAEAIHRALQEEGELPAEIDPDELGPWSGPSSDYPMGPFAVDAETPPACERCGKQFQAGGES